MDWTKKYRTNVVGFCETAVAQISTQIFGRLSFADASEKIALETEAKAAEQAFIGGLRRQAFDAIRDRSQAEIDDMVEFMPKQELADMAEALVNLTSLKRRVSRGMETVGGPIDVAVISKSEGFVWVKRKHYFPADLNARYYNRVREHAFARQGANDAKAEKSRRSRPPRGGTKGPSISGGTDA